MAHRQLNIILPSLVNGPPEVGLSAVAGDHKNSSLALNIYPSLYNTMRPFAARTGISAEFMHIVRVCVYMTFTLNWHTFYGKTEGNVRTHEDDREDAAGEGEYATTQAWIDRISADDINKAALLICSTKVNMWQINHHVGQNATVGFALKAWFLIMSTKNAPSETERSMIWEIGHWVSTKAMWNRWGVLDLSKLKETAAGATEEVERIPLPTRDIIIRLEAGPAGAAKVMVHRAIVFAAERSGFSVLLPPNVQFAALAALPAACMSAIYHDGSKYHTGLPKEELLVLSEDTIDDLASFIHATQPAGTLAKAKVIKEMKYLGAHGTFLRLQAVMIAIRNTAASERDQYLVSLTSGAGANADPFAAMRAVANLPPRHVPSRQEVDEAIAANGEAQVPVGRRRMRALEDMDMAQTMFGAREEEPDAPIVNRRRLNTNATRARLADAAIDEANRIAEQTARNALAGGGGLGQGGDAPAHVDVHVEAPIGEPINDRMELADENV